MNQITKDMHDIARAQSRYRVKYMEALGLKGCHANYLLALCAEPGISQEQLSARIYADKSNVARQLAMLEEGGYVRREVDRSDKRVMLVYPTEKALGLLPLIIQKQAEWETFVTETLSVEEREQMRELLKKIKHRTDAFFEKESK